MYSHRLSERLQGQRGMWRAWRTRRAVWRAHAPVAGALPGAPRKRDTTSRRARTRCLVRVHTGGCASCARCAAAMPWASALTGVAPHFVVAGRASSRCRRTAREVRPPLGPLPQHPPRLCAASSAAASLPLPWFGSGGACPALRARGLRVIYDRRRSTTRCDHRACARASSSGSMMLGRCGSLAGSHACRTHFAVDACFVCASDDRAPRDADDARWRQLSRHSSCPILPFAVVRIRGDGQACRQRRRASAQQCAHR